MSSKADLRAYLQVARDVMLWKLDGLSEYDVRRPLVPTGTSLLGLVKHLSGCEMGYFGSVFGRPCPDLPAWDAEVDADPLVDMFARADETREEIVELYGTACAHADATIEALDLGAVGRVPHWPPERAEITLHRALVHMIAETHRHAGHADILRELIDGAAGHRPAAGNLADDDAEARARSRARIEEAARPWRA